jgi:dCTP deaminase
MILSGGAIGRSVRRGDIVIEPFDEDQLTTNSYDFRLGRQLRVYEAKTLDTRRENSTRLLEIPADGMQLSAGELYLGHTAETMGSRRYVPIVKGKSSVARLGLFIHVTADLIDIGSINQWTLQLVPMTDVVVYPGMLIGQVTFWEIRGRSAMYSGKYQGSKGPLGSLIHLDQFRETN